MASSRVAVVGGGLAGLSGAMELKNAGRHVELFERARLLGGRATSFEVDGHVVDNGQHVYLACCTEFQRFVEHAGMADALYLQKNFEVVAFGKGGRRSILRAAPLPAPFHIMVSFARYRHLRLRAKLQIIRALLALKRGLRPGDRSKSFAAWLHEHGQGPEALAAFWEPFLVPALNAPLDRMNAADAAFVLSRAFLGDRGAARFGYSRVPLAVIMDAAAAKLDRVHRACAVSGLRIEEARVVLETSAGEERFDAALFAVSPRALQRIAFDGAIPGLPRLDTYEPCAIMDVHLWFEGAMLDFDFAALLDSPVQWVFRKAPGYLCCSISAADEIVAVPTTQMVELAWDAVRARIPALRAATLTRGAATRNPDGTYLPAFGTLRPGPRTALPNVAIAGAWTDTGWPDTMESAVRSGIAAARALITT